MKRASAWAAYAIGGLWSIKAAIGSLGYEGFFPTITGLMWALALWWFTVGLGVRLGVEPYEFVDDIKRGLGFRRPAENNEDLHARL